MFRKSRAFTLLELLAAITILVILGAMLFEVFGKSSDVVRISNARQDIFQYARAALEFMEREISGAFTSVDANVVANTNTGIKGMRVYNHDDMGVPRREDSQGIFFSTGIMARDTRETVGGSPNPFFGHDVNVARIGYYLNSETSQLWKAAICRTEMYDLTIGIPEPGGPFVRNCLFFKLWVISPFGDENPTQFQTMDWNSESPIQFQIEAIEKAFYNQGSGPGLVTVSRRKSLPRGIYITMRITDEQDARQYVWGDDPADSKAPKKWYIAGPDPKKDYWVDEDPVVQTFSQTIYFGRRSD